MYVVVQRVVSPATRETGVNVFVYLHAGRRWQVPPKDIPGSDPGQLARKSIAVEPNGNRVRSNLDVVAPDDIELPELRAHLMAFVDRCQFEPFPWEGAEGPCVFRLHMVPQLVNAGWGREAKALAAAGAALVERARQKPSLARSTSSRR
jgi:hypothetical protein